jgi:hypothetical protein
MSGTTKKRVHMPDIIKEINAELNLVKDAKLQVFLKMFLRPKITEAIKERKNELGFSFAELEKMFHEVGLDEAKMSFDAAFTTKKEHFEYWYSLYKSNPRAVKQFADACRSCWERGDLSRNKSLCVDGPVPGTLIRRISGFNHRGGPLDTETPLTKEELREVTNYWWKQFSIVDLNIDLPFRWLALLKKSGLSASISSMRFNHSFYVKSGSVIEYPRIREMILTDYTLLREHLIIIKNTLENLHLRIYWE